MMDLADATLDELRQALAPAVASNAAFDGWSDAALHAAADAHNVDHDVARLAFPGGAVAMIDAWFGSIDHAMAAHFTPEALAAMKIRQRITALVETRLELLTANREALRRAAAILAMPHNIARAAKLGWRSADVMWRLAGDTATDYNHYTKRALLCGIYTATLAVFVEDHSEDKAETRAFLDRRIENVMQFEKAKAQLLGNREGFDVARFLGRLRYPAR
jgi:ubiquinone biosynthesis protein COQ9